MDESVVKHLEQPAQITKLSQAMRVGAAMRPQCFGEWYTNRGSCALGAAAEGYFGSRAKSGTDLMSAFPELIESVGNPVGLARKLEDGSESDRLIDQIIVLNDKALWTREQIADWLESQGY